MKFLLFLFLAQTSFAVTFEVIGRNGAQLFQDDIRADLPMTLGQLSIEALLDAGIPHRGSHAGLQKIGDIGPYNEVISDSEMKAWGWCYSLDGRTPPDLLADQVIVRDQDSRVTWYYSFAHYKFGRWVSMCK